MSGSIRISPLGVEGRPRPFVPPLKADLELPLASKSVAMRYASALEAHIDELRKTRRAYQRVELLNGRLDRSADDPILYRFPYAGDADLFNDARVHVEINRTRYDAVIAAFGGGAISLALNAAVGSIIERAMLMIDKTALLEALKDALAEIDDGGMPFNTALANAAIGLGEAPEVQRFDVDGADLNASQQRALQAIAQNALTFLWGPPGTGKTQTLRPALISALRNGRRVLVCSNTNRAVDQVLHRAFDGLSDDEREAGAMVRVGRIQDDKLKEHAPFVSLEGIVGRRATKHKQQQAELRVALNAVDERLRQAERTLTQFGELEAQNTRVALAAAETNALAQEGKNAKENAVALGVRVAEFELERARRRAANMLSALFHRGPAIIEEDLRKATAEHAGASAKLRELSARYKAARAQHERVAALEEALAKKLAGMNRAALRRQTAADQREREAIEAQIQVIDEELAQLHANTLRNARIVGATITKAYLSDLGAFDLVIIDEASMALLPALYFVVGLAKERVVISGDYRQLPSIIETDQQAIFDELGRDIFEASGAAKDTHPHKVMLEEQYRMDAAICDLVSRHMYKGKLVTAAARRQQPEGDDILSAKLLVIDTSDLAPFESKDQNKSRFNIMHALIVRRLLEHFAAAGRLDDTAALGVCTPYRAQTLLHKRVAEAVRGAEQIMCGTVHAFQGDERETIILDIADGAGSSSFPGLGLFIQGNAPAHIGARLINVAVTRAKEQLIVIANLEHLEQRLPGDALLRSILYDMQRRGRVVAAHELFPSSSTDPTPEQALGASDIAGGALLRGAAFDRALRDDIARAQKSIVIFSAFVTSRAVAALSAALQARIAAGVQVRCVTRPPTRNGTIPILDARAALDHLESIGCAVDLRANMHEKAIVLDGGVVWMGSQNILSNSGRTDEIMARMDGAGVGGRTLVLLSCLPTLSEAVAIARAAEAENPRCETCGGRTVLLEGRGKSIFQCEDAGGRQCGWRSDG